MKDSQFIPEVWLNYSSDFFVFLFPKIQLPSFPTTPYRLYPITKFTNLKHTKPCFECALKLLVASCTLLWWQWHVIKETANGGNRWRAKPVLPSLLEGANCYIPCFGVTVPNSKLTDSCPSWAISDNNNQFVVSRVTLFCSRHNKVLHFEIRMDCIFSVWSGSLNDKLSFLPKNKVW